jgi:hypothetical protein
VTELHAMLHRQCSHTVCSIRKTFYKLENSQPRTGNPTIPPMTLLPKEIHEAINVKADVTDADVTDFFDEGGTEVEPPADEDDNELAMNRKNPLTRGYLLSSRLREILL